MGPSSPTLYDASGRPIEPTAPKDVEEYRAVDDYTSAPAPHFFQELPVYGVPPPDRVWQIEAALQQLEVGNFYECGQMWDAMWRDARIRGVMQTRIQGVLGSGIECHGYGGEDEEDAKAMLIADELRAAWPRMHAAADLGKAMRYALGLGVCAVQKVWTTRGGRWEYRLKTWHPKWLVWRNNTRAYHLTTQNMGQIRMPRPDEQSADWILFTPFGFENAFMEGLVRSFPVPWLSRNWNQSDWDRYNEIHGRPIKLAHVPQEAKDSDKRAFVSSLARMHAEAVVRLPRDREGKSGYGLSLLEAVANTYMTFKDKLAWGDRTIAVLALGQSTSTDGATGLGSDQAPGDSVRLDVKQFDNGWTSQALYTQGVREWTAYNFGSDPELAPAPPADDKRSGYWQVEPAEDSSKRATELRDFATGFATLKNATKAIDERALLDENGLPLVTEEEQAALEEADAQQKREAAERIAQPPPAGGAAPAKQAPPPRANAVRALSTAGRRRLRPGARAGVRYADRVADDAKARAVEALMGNVEELRKEVAASTGPEDLKRRLTALYRTMSPRQLAALVEKANLLAKLAGRAAVVKDL